MMVNNYKNAYVFLLKKPFIVVLTVICRGGIILNVYNKRAVRIALLQKMLL